MTIQWGDRISGLALATPWRIYGRTPGDTEPTFIVMTMRSLEGLPLIDDRRGRRRLYLAAVRQPHGGYSLLGVYRSERGAKAACEGAATVKASKGASK